MEFSFQEELQDGLAIGHLSGEVDSSTAPHARDALLPFLQSHQTIILDMSGLTFLSSAGIRVMLLLYRQASSLGGRIVLVALPEDIRCTMEATGFLGFFEVCDSIEQAKDLLVHA